MPTKTLLVAFTHSPQPVHHMGNMHNHTHATSRKSRGRVETRVAWRYRSEQCLHPPEKVPRTAHILAHGKKRLTDISSCEKAPERTLIILLPLLEFLHQDALPISQLWPF
jgi:hypothetical protein